MIYKYPPIYKYGMLLLVIFLLLKHQKILSQDKVLTNSIIITLIIALFDYIIIDNHPGLLESNSESSSEKSTKVENFLFDNQYDDDDIDEIIESYDVSILNELENDNKNKYKYKNIGYKRNPKKNQFRI
jgi:hypothetical protein